MNHVSVCVCSISNTKCHSIQKLLMTDAVIHKSALLLDLISKCYKRPLSCQKVHLRFICKVSLCPEFFIFQGLCIISSVFAFSPHYSFDFPLVDLVYANL